MIKPMKNKKTNLCRLCERVLPPPSLYASGWCWICWRTAAEFKYSRHYYLGTKGWERSLNHFNKWWQEATELTGVLPLEENQPLIELVYRCYKRKGKVKKQKKPLSRIGDIQCTAKDIGKPLYPPKKMKK